MSSRCSIPALVCALSLSLLVGCGGDGATSADRASELYADGLVELYEALDGTDLDNAPWEWGADVQGALSKFEEALGNDPDHCGALMGAALTRALGVLTDPRLGDMLSELFPGTRVGPGRPLLWYAERPSVADATRLALDRRGTFHLSELQAFIEETALPEFAIAEQHLSRFEDLSCEFDLIVILPDSAGRRDQIRVIELDVTDACLAHAALDALQAICHVLAAYDLDAGEGETLQYLIEEDDDYLTLREGGHMPAAFTEIGCLGARLVEAAGLLAAEHDSQGNDLITESEGLIRLDEILEGSSVDIVAQLGEDVGTALSEGLAVTLTDVDPEAPDLQILIDLDELLNDPLPDLRAFLPAHTWPEPDTMRIDRPVSMPDPTLDGVTPEMTNGDWDVLIPWLLE